MLIKLVIHLVLTLPVSTATTERAFSAMSLIRTSFCNKMENEFLSNCMIVYAEREIVDNIDSESIVDEFYRLKPRKVQLQLYFCFELHFYFQLFYVTILFTINIVWGKTSNFLLLLGVFYFIFLLMKFYVHFTI